MNQPSNQVKQICRNQIGSDQKASISQVDQNFYCQSLGVHLDRNPNHFDHHVDVHFQSEHKLRQLFVLSDQRIELHENAEKM